MSDSFDQSIHMLPEGGHPFAERKTVQNISNQNGSIVQLDNVNFGIQSDGIGAPLLPANLPVAFKHPGLKIIFSGSVKEMNLNEFTAGQPFVLSKISAL